MSSVRARAAARARAQRSRMARRLSRPTCRQTRRTPGLSVESRASTIGRAKRPSGRSRRTTLLRRVSPDPSNQVMRGGKASENASWGRDLQAANSGPIHTTDGVARLGTKPASRAPFLTVRPSRSGHDDDDDGLDTRRALKRTRAITVNGDGQDGIVPHGDACFARRRSRARNGFMVSRPRSSRAAPAMLDGLDSRTPVPLIPMMANHQKQEHA